jgi:hypothetical protein
MERERARLTTTSVARLQDDDDKSELTSEVGHDEDGEKEMMVEITFPNTSPEGGRSLLSHTPTSTSLTSIHIPPRHSIHHGPPHLLDIWNVFPRYDNRALSLALR